MEQPTLAETEAETLDLPPLYRQLAVGAAEDPVEVARARAAEGDAEALFVWSRRADWADCAVVLAPDRPLRECLKAGYVTLVGAGDALGATVPTVVQLLFGWPDRIEINRGLCGGIRLACPPEAILNDVPDWLVVGLTLWISPPPDDGEPGLTPDRTTLHEEGCGELDAAEFLQSFSRHFLYWLNRWVDDGFGAVRTSWLARARGREEPSVFDIDGAPVEAKISGLDGAGGLVLEGESGTATLPLDRLLHGPGWKG